MKSLDIPIVITPTLTLPPQEGEGNSRVSGWTLVIVNDLKKLTLDGQTAPFKNSHTKSPLAPL